LPEGIGDGLAEAAELRLVGAFAGRIGGQRQKSILRLGDPHACRILRHCHVSELRPHHLLGGVMPKGFGGRIGRGAAEDGRQAIDLAHVADAVGLRGLFLLSK
jgi:hypothetical protein